MARRRTWTGTVAFAAFLVTIPLTLFIHLFFIKNDDEYAATPFCTPGGNCGENPSYPSPRTIYSSRSREQYNMWIDMHERLNQSAEEFIKGLESGSTDGKKPLVLLGDSITESYLGTSYGVPQNRFADVPSVLEEVYGDYYPLILAIAGDQTQHLLWRIQNGNLPQSLADNPDAIYVILIGTNNLSSGVEVSLALEGVETVTRFVAEATKGKVLSVELLPRGDSHRLKQICPSRCDEEGQPLQSFMPDVNTVNEGLRTHVAEGYEGRIFSINCSDAFLPTSGRKSTGEEVNVDLMPDRLHPNKNGHLALAMCILEYGMLGKS